MGSFFPEPVTLPSYPPPATSPVLLDPPALTLKEEKYLESLIEGLHEGDEKIDLGGAGDTIENDSATEEEEEHDADLPLEFESIFSSSLPTWSSFSPTSDTYARPPAKRKDGTVSLAPSAKNFRPHRSFHGVSITSRITPQAPLDQSLNDNNEYRVITLSNGIRAVLVRRPKVKNDFGRRGGSEYLKEIRQAIEEDTKFQSERCLPFGRKSLPLANLVMGEAIAQVVEKAINSNNSTNTTQQELIFSPGLSTKESRKNNEASLAISVNVGHADAPPNCLGLAHFLEHMVHYGSEKYPKQEELMQFLITQGYTFNAFTETHLTTYYNSITSNCISKAMDMVTSMLAKPLLEDDMTDREVHAVDSEFYLRKDVQIIRKHALLAELFNTHPLGKFGCGSEETLTSPKDLHKTIREFHKRHYVGSAMTVGFESTLPFEQQEALILEYFSNIPRGARGILRETRPLPKDKTLKVVGNKDLVIQSQCSFSNLWLLWPISEAFVDKFENKTLDVLSHLLWDEAEGSLAHFLTEKKYIWLMLCNSKLDSFLLANKYVTFFTIDYMLTTEGQIHVPDIVRATYSFFQQLEKVSDSQWQTIFTTMKLRHQRQSKYGGDSQDKTFPPYIAFAQALQKVEPKDILDIHSWNDAHFSPREIHTLLRYLKPDNMISIQTLPSSVPLRNYMNGATTREIPYYNAEYVSQPIKTRFGNLSGKNLGSGPDLQVVLQRMKLERVITYLTTEPAHYGNISGQEIQLKTSWGVKVTAARHLGNDPDNYTSICITEFINPDVMSSARNLALTLLWVTSQYFMSMQEIKNYSDYFIAFVPHSIGVAIFYVGFEEKMYPMIEALNKRLFLEKVTESNLSMAKTALKTIYDLAFATQTMGIFNDMMHFMLCNHSGDPLSDALVHIQNCTLNEVNAFSEAFKWKSIGYMLFAGNVSVKTATHVVELVNRQTLKYARYFSTVRFVVESLFRPKSCHPFTNYIPPGEKCIRFKSDNFYASTTTVQNYYCVGSYNAAEYSLWRNSLSLIRIKCFQYLRMIKQLGYAVGVSFPRPVENQPMIIGVFVTATALNYTACELDQHLDDFMVYYGQFLNELDQKTFEKLTSECGRDKQFEKANVTEARFWYDRYFGSKFASLDPLKFKKLGMYKLSMQMIANESKSCDCEKCQNISAWKSVQFWKHFKFANGKSAYKTYFIDDPKRIRNNNHK